MQCDNCGHWFDDEVGPCPVCLSGELTAELTAMRAKLAEAERERDELNRQCGDICSRVAMEFMRCKIPFSGSFTFTRDDIVESVRNILGEWEELIVPRVTGTPLVDAMQSYTELLAERNSVGEHLAAEREKRERLEEEHGKLLELVDSIGYTFHAKSGELVLKQGETF